MDYKTEENIIYSNDILSNSNGAFENCIGTLEFDKILEKLCVFAPFPACVDIIKHMRPSVSYNNICEMQKETSEARDLILKKGAPSFYGVVDITDTVFRAKKGASLNTHELLSVAEVLRCVSSLVGYFGNTVNEASSLFKFSSRLIPNKFLYETITNAIIGEDIISDNASGELYDIRRKIKNIGNKVRESLQKYIMSPQYSKVLQENIVTIRNGRYVLPVKAEYKNEINGLVHDTSASGATLFIEPMTVVEANNELRVLSAREAAEIEKILYRLTSEVLRFSDVIENDFKCLLEIGVVFAKAELSSSMDATSPIINQKKIIELIKARHPLLDKDKCVPIDISVGKKYKMLVITGPNTGGKTVSLKTLGLFSLMAQSGLHIPCAEGSTVPVFTSILADIGDEQSIEQSLSTFSAHMVNIVGILSRLDENSLVLFDELGAGTDPVEGAALAQAILERVRDVGALCGATTHYAELKVYALETDGVSNASCEFDIETLSPTYKLTIGIPGRSNAFAIAQRLGISNSVIDSANEFIPGQSRRFEEVVSELEETRSRLEKERASVKKLREQLTEEKEAAKKDREELNLKISVLEENAEKEARKLIDSAKATSDYILEEMNELRRKKDAEDFAKAIADSKAKVSDKIKSTNDKLGLNLEKAQSIYKPSREFQVGDDILVFDLKKEGKITKIDKDFYFVKIGYAKLKTSSDNLRLLSDIEDDMPKQKSKNKFQRKNGGSMSTPAVSARISAEIDVRGMIGDDAWMAVDKYIDEALLANLPSVTVIHGKGTGALRQAIQSRLRRDKRVDSIRNGAYGEGDSGVTVITLK